MQKQDVPFRILIIDDDEDDYFITSEFIKKIPGQKFTISWCPRYGEALNKMQDHQFDIYFVDYYLGAKTGLDLLKEAILLGCEEPVVLLTGRGNRELDMESMQSGAYDYLVKAELNSEKIERCIRYSLERAATAKALRDNERKFRSIFERSKDAVFLSNEQLYFRNANDASSLLLGYDLQELQHLTLYSLMPNKKDAKMLEEKFNAEGLVDDLEVDIQDKDGNRKTCILSISRESDGKGNIYVQGILHDISNMKKAEKANLQLQKLGMANRLVRTLAHEVRNPLNNINLATEQLMQEETKDTARVFIDIVQRNSQRIGDLIDELLTTSKPATVEMTEHTLQTILDESIAAALDRITLKRIKLELSYPDELLKIRADLQKLKIAFLNIIINAIEAMEEDRGKLLISLRNIGLEHVVVISDNGTGISQENLSRLFEPYFTSKRNGMGLGLASTLNILQSHQAFIDVRSKLNEGTAFIITFKAS